MKTSLLWKQYLIGVFILALLTSCATAAPEPTTPEPTATIAPMTAIPRSTACEEVEGICLDLTFDGENCTYVGPTEFSSGPVTLIFNNKSEELAMVNLGRHKEDKTIQDMLELIGEEGSGVHSPIWYAELEGVYTYVRTGESNTWEGDLEPGIHTLVCLRNQPFGVWFGAGLTVVE